ncbi:hypothetical protein GmHk_13G036250 [Glycine max]|nr:hypothetical protein GmHk_13G036250 [Glycine max]
MNHKGIPSFVFSVYTKKQIPLLAMNPKGPSSFVFSVEERSPEFQEPLDLRSNPFQGGGDDAILP